MLPVDARTLSQKDVEPSVSRGKAAIVVEEILAQRGKEYVLPQFFVANVRRLLDTCPYMLPETLQKLREICLQDTRDALGRQQLYERVEKRIAQGY